MNHRRDVDGTALADRVRVVSDLAKDFVSCEAFRAFLLRALLLVALNAQLGSEMLDLGFQLIHPFDDRIDLDWIALDIFFAQSME